MENKGLIITMVLLGLILILAVTSLISSSINGDSTEDKINNWCISKGYDSGDWYGGGYYITCHRVVNDVLESRTATFWKDSFVWLGDK